MQNLIDLRSDTVTRPTPGMRAAMAAAEVGDDVYGDDPTVNRLQAMVAERFGYPGALFFATGTQSNLAALMAHCGRGDEILVGQDAHIYTSEQGGAAVLGGIMPHPLEHDPAGGIAIERIARAIKPDDVHYVRTRLLALENTIGGRGLAAASLLGRPECSPRPGYTHSITMCSASKRITTMRYGWRRDFAPLVSRSNNLTPTWFLSISPKIMWPRSRPTLPGAAS